jgi:hypothetical protein
MLQQLFLTIEEIFKVAYGNEDFGNRNVEDQDFVGGRTGMVSSPRSVTFFLSRSVILEDAFWVPKFQ